MYKGLHVQGATCTLACATITGMGGCTPAFARRHLAADTLVAPPKDLPVPDNISEGQRHASGGAGWGARHAHVDE